VFHRWLWRLPGGCKSVALTFDDGPHATTTPALLAALGRLQIPATHFLLGSRCAHHAALVRELAAAGQTIGNHGFDHRSLLLRSARCQEDSIRRADEAIHAVLHESPRLFRPPYGHFNVATTGLLQAMTYTGVLWSLNARDWGERGESALWKRLERNVHEGAIILLHDGHPATAAVVRLLPRLADEVARRGWSFVSLKSFGDSHRNRLCR
jgi:peptidoglycan/xylan/chitin deacetylase (PgdA/CDA1 family)